LIAFTWLGIAQPRGVAFWFIPLFVFSYMAPLLLLDRTAEAIRSVIYALPVCLLISEALAWVAERLRKVQLALSRSEARFRSLVQHASDMVLITAEDGTIRYLSPSVERILGHSTTALLHTKLLDLIHPDDLPAIQATFDLVLQQPGVTGPIECRIRHQDGSWRYIETTSTNLSDDVNVQGIVLNSRDITERKALEAQLKHQAFHDPLTGLVNRAAFSDRVEHALMRMERRGATLAVLFLDLDNFKIVNDQYGHAAGDQLLVTVAERLRECLRASDVAARLGGDEFAILLDEVNDTSNVVQVAERLLHALRLPFILEGQPVNVGVSIGIAWSYPGQSAADLLRHADIAMYSVKHTGKGRYAVFEPDNHLRPQHRPLIEFSGSTR
jgi:diguanylate cyclase (GGDEF)-like protein/PAS domain S-box-containing protein